MFCDPVGIGDAAFINLGPCSNELPWRLGGARGLIVPNFVPDPVEVAGSIQEEPYLLRVAFIRRVTALHMLSLSVVAGLAFGPWPSVGLWPPLIALAAAFVALDLWRIRTRGKDVEARLSGASLPILLALTGWFVHEGARSGWPVAAPMAGAVCAASYTFLCGRDFSFVGCTLLSWIVSAVLLAGLSLHFNVGSHEAAVALAVNSAYLLYLQYDLASLLARRRRGEELAAVVDLYRDVFNFFGYALRVWRHWRKHRIWEVSGLRS